MFQSFGDDHNPPTIAQFCTDRPRRLQKKRERDILNGSIAEQDDVVAHEEVMTINVSGLRFQTRKSTLSRFPTTLLGSHDREKYYNPKTREYFFDRHRESFETILYFYQSDGLLCLPATLNPDIFTEEVRFFRLGEHILDKLCPDAVPGKQLLLPDHPIQKKVWQVGLPRFLLRDFVQLPRSRTLFCW